MRLLRPWLPSAVGSAVRLINLRGFGVWLPLPLQVPYSFAFSNRDQDAIVIVDTICDSLFMLDIVFNFCYAFVDANDRLVTGEWAPESSLPHPRAAL